jgi:hypothetical protein
MDIIKNVMATESVQNIILESEESVNTIIDHSIEGLINENIAVVKENLNSFVGDSVLETYENIKDFVTNNTVSFLNDTITGDVEEE